MSVIKLLYSLCYVAKIQLTSAQLLKSKIGRKRQETITYLQTVEKSFLHKTAATAKLLHINLKAKFEIKVLNQVII